MPFSQCPESSL